MQRHAATPLEVQDFDGVLDGLFHGLVAVFVHIGLALGPVGDAACAADAAAFAGHTLDKVVGQHILAGPEQGGFAFGDTVAGNGVEGELLRGDTTFLQGLFHRHGQTAAAGKDPAEIGGVVQGLAGERGKVDLLAVEEGLQFFKGEDAVHQIPMNTTLQPG